MKRISSTFVGLHPVLLALLAAAAGLTGSASAQTDGTVLVLQQTPAQGGSMTPGEGVHHFEPYSQVTLTAVPKPGYQFVYWLGDVSDPTANSTTVYLDAPKIIIAVFEQTDYELLVPDEGLRWLQSAPRGRTGLFASARDYSRTVYTGGRGTVPRRRKWRWPPPPEIELPDDFPVPEQGDDFPVPIPEPAAGVLLVLSSLLALAKHRPNRSVQ
jgi:hypothetical protein